MTYMKALQYGRIVLKGMKIETYSLDATLLLAHVTNKSKVKIYTNPESELTDKQLNEYESLIEDRARHKPIAYILGKIEFYGIDIKVSENTLIPRCDTEILVEKILGLAGGSSFAVLELCTGSGCISTVLALCLKKCNFTITDISPEALEVAKENVARYNLKNRFNIVESDLFESTLIFEDTYNIIIANPPYIETDEIEFLDRNVREFEPALALDGGSDGLYFYRQISENAKDYFNNGHGILAFEIGYNQGDIVRDLMQMNGYKNVQISQDLGGHDRVIVGYL